ncbi:uncharacterized protein LOC106642709 [Copidosoma floridanum]|uniref:uncharacterized protein LOC106642709 n=1 Tax=Copidosoma floridanum TaxID=29053 RepID=UPI0006C9A9BD|nr:uncharacterized protein LOC106642709 [Copidosoma floridanum]XP_014213057.1 uncharacterized protein LOC106642709 [Copidosoma floridanum]
MLTVLCPNCRHRFPAPGCCTGPTANNVATSSTSFTFDGFADKFNNDPTNGLLYVNATTDFSGKQQQVTISTQCGIQSGGCLIQNKSSADVLPVPRVEVKSTLSSGGCLVQKKPEEQSSAAEEGSPSWDGPMLISEEQLRKSFEQAAQFQKSHSRSTSTNFDAQQQPARTDAFPDPLGKTLPTQNVTSAQPKRKSCESKCCCYCRCCYSDDEDMVSGSTQKSQKSNCCSQSSGNDQCLVSENHRLAGCCRKNNGTGEPSCNMETDKYSGDVRIQVNATVRLPSSTNSCTLNITTTTTTTASPVIERVGSANGLLVEQPLRPRNNLNGGGIVNINLVDGGDGLLSFDNHREEQRQQQPQQPSTPLSWLAPCPWGFVNGPTNVFLLEKDHARLAEVRKLLQASGWYYEGISWQQSEDLLKNSPVGTWLMRDSSDSRYTFAVSVQTARGPTSVRVFYFMGKFRLDAEPRLAMTMPLFDCPIKMIEYYVEFSKQFDPDRREVWVDYTGHIYSQIYLSDPLLKKVRSLAHLARIAVNRAGLEKEKERLPPLIKNYLAEYPYSM